MIVQSKKLIPEVYQQSYDMSIFTGLLDIIYTSRELYTNRERYCHIPSSAFEEDLPSLASLFHLEHTSNRDLISLYRSLQKQKGSRASLVSAVALAHGLLARELLNSESDQYKKVDKLDPSFNEESDVVYTIDKKNQEITIYLHMSAQNLYLLNNLIYRLAPVHTSVCVKDISERP